MQQTYETRAITKDQRQATDSGRSERYVQLSAFGVSAMLMVLSATVVFAIPDTAQSPALWVVWGSATAVAVIIHNVRAYTIRRS